MSTPRLVLASNSRYRKELLARLEVPFEVAAPRFDEAAERPRFAELGAAASHGAAQACRGTGRATVS